MNDEQALTKSFRDHGFIFLRGFLCKPEVSELRDRIARFVREVVPRMPEEEVFYELKSDIATLKQLQRMFRYNPQFERLMFGSRFEQLATTLLKHPVRGVNMQYFNKPPGIGQPTPPHQDGYYFMLEPNEAVTMWSALEETDEENGCVRYVRGSHVRGMRPHAKTGTLGFSQGITDFGTEQDQQSAVAFPARAGDLLVHHALTIHWADGNQSQKRTRQALGFIYYSTAASKSTEKRRRHAELIDELKRSGRI